MTIPKTYKNGTRELRAYEILRPFNQGTTWKRLEAKKLTPTVAYGLYTKVATLGGVETRMYRAVVAEWQREGKESKAQSTVRAHLVDVEDWLTEQRRAYRQREGKKKIDRFLNALILPEK